MAKIVVALGGNALGNNPQEQKEIVKQTAKNLVDIIVAGHQLVVVHGNGPQVGMINQAFSLANLQDEASPLLEFPECGSMSQGYIGFHLQNALNNELKKRQLEHNIATIITQAIVDQNDEAFKNPTKPIGMFYNKTQADSLSKIQQWIMKEDSGRGWRRVVASPKPLDIVEKNILTSLLNNQTIIIAGGGGGIPVYEQDNNLISIAAVIDKDFAAAKIAQIISADKLIILTAVNQVMINYNKPNQQALSNISCAEIKKLIAAKEFGEGSMLPKIEAVLSFVNNSGQDAVIGALEEAENVIKGLAGTTITK